MKIVQNGREEVYSRLTRPYHHVKLKRNNRKLKIEKSNKKVPADEKEIQTAEFVAFALL